MEFINKIRFFQSGGLEAYEHIEFIKLEIEKMAKFRDLPTYTWYWDVLNQDDLDLVKDVKKYFDNEGFKFNQTMNDSISQLDISW